MKGKRVILSLVFLVLGFMIAFSYNLTSKKEKQESVNENWNAEYHLREQYIEQEEQNRKLQQQVINTQEKIAKMETNLAQGEQVLADLAEEAEKYRMFLGKVKVQGSGVEVTLSDGEYDAAKYNINEYIVHEHHVFNVINELYISGAEAVAVNGQRLKHDSYIVCNGPVITVDGQQHPAPFVITAIGKPNVLEAALMLTGGIRDQLVNENIVFALEKKDKIILDPIMGS
ncbi:DUF881 domain-containing protein [Bacillus massiliigorillae]|uniref:DUF881 domain-containing protein n=1 Tax=Bacillus massiliigorillae TaxID=1243664 RepID=UPI0005A96C35|nr:DUF881 domain-containing protein [Bacillus massiliigorillae]